MRIAVVTRHFPNSNERWAGHSGYQTLRVLAESCDLQVFYPQANYPFFLSPPNRDLRLDRNWNPPGVKTTYVPYPALAIVSRPVNGWTIARQLLPHIRRYKPDIILNYFVHPDGHAAVLIAKALGVPCVLTAVGSDLNNIPDPLCRRLTRYTLRNADFVSTVSRDLCLKARVLGADPTRSRVKLNGCDTKVFHPRDRQQARKELDIELDLDVIAYVGRLDVRKGLIELIEAVVHLARKRPKLRCYLIGDGRDKSILLKAITRLDAAEWVRLVPACPTGGVAVWMAAADLTTLPSYNEGCPNVILEALASGRPVVASNVGGIPELMDDTCGRMVPPKDVPALSNALDEVLTQSWNPADICARHARSWDNVAGELKTVLEETLSRRGGKE